MRAIAYMSMLRSSLPLLLLITPAFAFAGSSDVTVTSTTDSTPAPASTSFADSNTLSGYFLGKDNALDSAYDALQAWKKEYHLPFTFGANSWWHVDRNEHIYGDGYGVPGEQGTYFYFADFDPSYTLQADGFLKEIGAHVDFRFRDTGDKFRSFYPGTYWLYETYAYAKTEIGTFKAGEIVKQFGIPGDGTWWEAVQYFDGQRFNPDWGFSWENKWRYSDRFTMDSTVQFFVAQAGVDGSEPGAVPDSVPGLVEKNTAVFRLVPTYKLGTDSTLAFGLSGQYGGIDGSSKFGTSPREGAWATDLTYTWRGFSIFGEFTQSYGALTPVNYVSGGPSDRVTTAEVGLAYKYGPMTYHADFSTDWERDPDGHQYVLDIGVTTQLTKNTTFYAEYVKWDVTNSANVTSKYDDGFELIIVWQF
jgi:hypothetical protein